MEKRQNQTERHGLGLVAPVLGRLGLMGAAVVATFSFGLALESHPQAITPCEAISYTTGEPIHPSAYPIGEVIYTFNDQIDPSLPNSDQKSLGKISKSQSGYQLTAAAIPTGNILHTPEFWVQNENNVSYNENIVVSLDTPKNGMIGVTDGCIEMFMNSSTVVTLPIH